MRYFLKRCGFQELGSVGEDGKPKRGRYLMSSKTDEVVDFFPPLSIEIPNDTAMLPIIPLYTRLKTYCSYVYHNSKYTGTTAKHARNEYRIYLNNEIENHQLYFTSEDIVIMRKSTTPALDESGNEQEVYYLDLLRDHSSALYVRLNKYIDSYPIKGGYAMFDGELPLFENQVTEFESGQYATDVVIDKSVTDRINKSTEENQNHIFNPATFRDFVLSGYGNACAISGQLAKGLIGTGVDVVYIRPRNDGGNCLPSNGISLAKQFSLAFLQGKFTLSDRYEIIIHPDSDIPELEDYRLKQIRIPPNKFFQPDKDSVRYHREHIYGSFKNV